MSSETIRDTQGTTDETASKAAEEKSRAALASLTAALLLTILKLVVGFSTNSLGVLSEVLHSGFDLLAAAITLFAVRAASRPADANHPYGHGKVEHLAALAETALLLLTCGWIVGEAVQRLLYKTITVTPSIWAFMVMLVSIIIDISRSRMLRRTAKKHRSQALEADALHFASDVWSSSAVLAGLGALWLAQRLAPDNPWRTVLAHADTLAALIVAAIVLKACYSLAKNAVDNLMDRAHGEERLRILERLEKVPGVVHVERLRIRTGGSAYFVDLSVAVDASLELEAAHETAHRAEEAVHACLPEADITVQVEPVRLSNADPRAELAVMNDFARLYGLSVRSVQFTPCPDGVHTELHVEADPELTLAQAHEKVDALETALRKHLSICRVITRLEPKLPLMEKTAALSSPDHMQWVEKAVEKAMAGLPMLSNEHALRLLEETNEGLQVFSLNLHCRMNGASSVLRAHHAAMFLEYRLREITLGRLGRIVVHIEPEKL